MKVKNLFLALALMPTLLIAGNYNYCGSYSDSSCCGWFSDVTIYGDWLYWRARRSNLDYLIPYDEDSSPQAAIGDVIKVEPEYESGFRIGIRKECDCVDFEVRYTYFHPSWTDSVSSPNGLLAGTRLDDKVAGVDIGDVEFARAKWDVDYDQIDVIMGYDLCPCSCFSSHIFGGFTWARIDQEYAAEYIDGTDFDRLRQELDMNAYGINIGIDASYQFWGCINFFGAFWYNALLGDFDRKWDYVTSNPFTGHLRDNDWEMLSVINLMVGLQYTYPLCCCFVQDLGISIGYEFHHWLDMPDFLAINGFDEQVLLDRRTNFDFDGLFVRVSLSF